MTVTVNVLGPNSKALVVDNDGQAGVTNAIRDLLVSAGWEIYDQIATNNVVMRSKCYDNVNYKYVQIYCSTAIALYINVFESWNATSHSGTNQVYLDGTGTLFPLTISLTTMTLNVFYSMRYLHIQVNGGHNARTNNVGVYEFTRDNPADTPALGVPNFFMTTGMNLNWDYIDTNAQYFNTVGGVPRNRAGLVGKPAAIANAIISPNGIIGNIGNSNYAGTSKAVYSAALGAMVATPTFVTTAANAADLTAIKSSQSVDATAASFDWRGRVFGLKTLPSGLGVYTDSVMVNCDADGFSDPSGTAVNHFILGNCVALPY